MPATQWLFRALYLSRMAGSSLARMHWNWQCRSVTHGLQAQCEG